MGEKREFVSGWRTERIDKGVAKHKWTYDELRATDTREQGWDRWEELVSAVREETLREVRDALRIMSVDVYGEYLGEVEAIFLPGGQCEIKEDKD